MTDAGAGYILSTCYSVDDIETGTEHLTHYVIIRADLPKGLMAAQIVHAAGESSPGNLSSGTYAVVLAVPGEQELLRVADALEASSIEHKLIHEPDAPWHGAAMAIGVAPGKKEVLRRVLSSIPLLR